MITIENLPGSEIKEIDGDPAYPIFNLSLTWTECRDGVLIDNSWNSISMMFKEWPSERTLWHEVEKHRMAYVISRRAYNFTVKVSFSRFETWCLTWFSHFTFDIGLDAGEVLASFHRYVNRYVSMQDPFYSRTREPNYLCLMGAEDTWRWRGADDSPPPCICPGCKKQKIVRIDH